MALAYADIKVEHREIALKSKPQSMLLASPKGTVPVLCVDGFILEQSLDIMRWALGKSDPENWALVDEHLAQTWIEKNDGPFKILLVQYKYPNRYPDCDQEKILGEAIELMLKPMEAALQSSRYLLGEKMTWVDVAIFPFIRQFAMVNSRRFEVLPFSLTKKWLNQFMECELFHSVMHQYPTWVD